MKKSIHFRFGLYVLLVTAAFVGTVYWFCHDTRFPPVFYLFYLFFLLGRKILGPNFYEWHESGREVSDRALIIGFFIFLVLFWVGGFDIAHYIATSRQVPKSITWTAIGVLWAICIYPGYQWWRAQSRVALA